MQEDLLSVIKSVHSGLRKRCLMGADPEEVWRTHTSDLDTLNSYAEAMKQLATVHWERDTIRETRIVWSEKFITSYYAADGLLQRLISKDRRSLAFHTEPPAESLALELLRCCGNVYDDVESCVRHQSEVKEALNSQLSLTQILLPLTQDIRLLDVGSCYAPFSKFSQFDCLSIDLCSASPEVYQCDFLHVSTHLVTDNSMSTSQALQTLTSTTTKSAVSSLPSNWFHAVVFSLLLEYLPTPGLRWRCCVRAHMLLQMNSVLVIITPDSNKQHRRAQQMKDWKLAIEHIGFRRCCYEKLDHMHCMAFRKTVQRADYSVLSEPLCPLMAGKMYIPQDFNTRLSDTAEPQTPEPSANSKPAVIETRTTQPTSEAVSSGSATNISHEAGVPPNMSHEAGVPPNISHEAGVPPNMSHEAGVPPNMSHEAGVPPSVSHQTRALDDAEEREIVETGSSAETERQLFNSKRHESDELRLHLPPADDITTITTLANSTRPQSSATAPPVKKPKN